MSTCPNCGYCEHCKRARTPTPHWVYPNWYIQTAPYPPATVTVSGTSVST